MKTLILLVVGLLAVGCETPLPQRPKANSVKQLTLEEKKVVGEYEFKYPSGDTHKQVYLENGIRKYYKNGKKQREWKWSIVDGKIHVKYDSGDIAVWRINRDKSITAVAMIKDGKRTDLPKKNQWTYKKIK